MFIRRKPLGFRGLERPGSLGSRILRSSLSHIQGVSIRRVPLFQGPEGSRGSLPDSVDEQPAGTQISQSVMAQDAFALEEPQAFTEAAPEYLDLDYAEPQTPAAQLPRRTTAPSQPAGPSTPAPVQRSMAGPVAKPPVSSPATAPKPAVTPDLPAARTPAGTVQTRKEPDRFPAVPRGEIPSDLKSIFNMHKARGFADHLPMPENVPETPRVDPTVVARDVQRTTDTAESGADQPVSSEPVRVRGSRRSKVMEIIPESTRASMEAEEARKNKLVAKYLGDVGPSASESTQPQATPVQRTPVEPATDFQLQNFDTQSDMEDSSQGVDSDESGIASPGYAELAAVQRTPDPIVPPRRPESPAAETDSDADADFYGDPAYFPDVASTVVPSSHTEGVQREFAEPDLIGVDDDEPGDSAGEQPVDLYQAMLNAGLVKPDSDAPVASTSSAASTPAADEPSPVVMPPIGRPGPRNKHLTSAPPPNSVAAKRETSQPALPPPPQNMPTMMDLPTIQRAPEESGGESGSEDAAPAEPDPSHFEPTRQNIPPVERRTPTPKANPAADPGILDVGFGGMPGMPPMPFSEPARRMIEEASEPESPSSPESSDHNADSSVQRMPASPTPEFETFVEGGDSDYSESPTVSSDSPARSAIQREFVPTDEPENRHEQGGTTQANVADSPVPATPRRGATSQPAVQRDFMPTGDVQDSPAPDLNSPARPTVQREFAAQDDVVDDSQETDMPSYASQDFDLPSADAQTAPEIVPGKPSSRSRQTIRRAPADTQDVGYQNEAADYSNPAVSEYPDYAEPEGDFGADTSSPTPPSPVKKSARQAPASANVQRSPQAESESAQDFGAQEISEIDASASYSAVEPSTGAEVPSNNRPSTTSRRAQRRVQRAAVPDIDSSESLEPSVTSAPDVSEDEPELRLADAPGLDLPDVQPSRSVSRSGRAVQRTPASPAATDATQDAQDEVSEPAPATLAAAEPASAQNDATDAELLSLLRLPPDTAIGRGPSITIKNNAGAPKAAQRTPADPGSVVQRTMSQDITENMVRRAETENNSPQDADSSESGSDASSVEKMAQEVYRLIRQRLKVERERFNK